MAATGWEDPNGSRGANGWRHEENGAQSNGASNGGFWPYGPPAPPGSPSSPCQVTVTSLQAGEVVDVFHRYCQDPNGYFMVQHGSSGFLHPSIGTTDGWTQARVTKNWNISSFNPGNHWSWVEIQWMHPLWYNRRGHKLDVSRPDMVTQKVLPDQIRRKGKPSEAQCQPRLTLFHLRWGGEQPVNPVTEGAGGWGQIGSTPSDNYINSWESYIYSALGPTYEIVSGFIQSSEELLKISPPLLRHLMHGQHLGALYFMWPIVYQDGHEFPAYVNSNKLLELMVHMEGTGIHSRFPHHSHLYRVFASKEWTSQMCLHPLLKTPLTTKVSRQAVAQNPAKAAEDAIKALQRLAEVRAAWSEPLGQGPAKVKPVNKGVAKLGWSWEAMDVQAWKNAQDLTSALAYLGEQPGSFLEFVFVQEWVDFDVEMRHFVVEADMQNPATWKAKKIIYTVFKSQEGNCFRDFDRFERKTCLQKTFHNDEEALADAERQAEVLIGHWLQWLQAQSHEMPVVTRFDILAKRIGPGRAQVMTGELTELGGCFLGWPKGPEVVFGAMLRSCFQDSWKNFGHS
mmetsp:Transcript_22836/g.53392  ORF Transcript_22836/g.53392 Transcript_22836/m.53392 type:complete len:567 (-) Transcript_22836:209-1909(-)